MKTNNNGLRKAGLACALLAPFLISSAYAADHWLKVEGADCAVWSDEPLKSGESIRWNGGCKDGRISGQGLLEVTSSGQLKLRFHICAG